MPETNWLSTPPKAFAPTIGATVTVDPTISLNQQWTPAQDETVNIGSVGLPGQVMTITLLTDGTAPYVISFNGNCYYKASINTGAVSGVAISFILQSDGSGWRHIGSFNTGTFGTNSTLRKEVVTDLTNATATMANITNLSNVVEAGGVYVGEMVAKCSNSTAAEGISFDFDGGTATMTAFAAGAGLVTGGTTVAVTTVSSALATDLNWTTITGETWFVIKFAFTVNAGGTLVPRFCEGTAHSAGTATTSRGTYIVLNKV